MSQSVDFSFHHISLIMESLGQHSSMAKTLTVFVFEPAASNPAENHALAKYTAAIWSLEMFDDRALKSLHLSKPLAAISSSMVLAINN